MLQHDMMIRKMMASSGRVVVALSLLCTASSLDEDKHHAFTIAWLSGEVTEQDKSENIGKLCSQLLLHPSMRFQAGY